MWNWPSFPDGERIGQLRAHASTLFRLCNSQENRPTGGTMRKAPGTVSLQGRRDPTSGIWSETQFP
jgi:hypothetical protein